MVRDVKIGKRYDGGRSPLQLAPVKLNETAAAREDTLRMERGLPPSPDGFIARTLRGWGYEWSRIESLRDKDKNKLIKLLTKEIIKIEHSMGYEHLGFTDKVSFDIGDEYRRARTALHVKLRKWAQGPLVLERPTGASLHHLSDYDARQGMAQDAVRSWFKDCQVVLVENDWGAAVPEMEGEWRVPFEFISWEFRISGVRVLAFTESDKEPNVMWCCYGADGHWVCDDYQYELGCPSLPRGIMQKNVDAKEFRRVAKMCYDTIRASCIMLDAQVAHHQHVAAPPKLVERRAREGRAPLRDHYVVRLLHAESRAYNQRARSGGAGTSGPRAPQRGHWRKATWVHYDDPDSGQVQYANDGGFVVSKTWRRWHFAGNPNDIIHKEYRL